MPLTKEELLRVRYKVISQYPFSPHPNGEIIYPKNGTSYYSQYPHIFQQSPWWSDRKVEDMPEYLIEVDSLYKIGEVVKVEEWDLENTESDAPWYKCEDDGSWWCVRGFEPATEQEYQAYINQKQQ